MTEQATVPTDGPERLTYTLKETADRLGVSMSTVRRAVASGSLPVVLLRRKKLVPVEALRNFTTTLVNPTEIAATA